MREKKPAQEEAQECSPTDSLSSNLYPPLHAKHLCSKKDTGLGSLIKQCSLSFVIYPISLWQRGTIGVACPREAFMLPWPRGEFLFFHAAVTSVISV